MDNARKEGLQIKYILNTHGHSDHTAGNDRLKDLTGASIARHNLDAGADVDIALVDEKPFQVGEIVFKPNIKYAFFFPPNTRP